MNYIGIMRKINGRDIWGFGTLSGWIDSFAYPTSMRDVQCALIGEKEPHILYETHDIINKDNGDIMHNNVSLNKDSIKNVTTNTYTKTERVKNINKSTQPYTVTYKDVATEYTKLTIEWIDGTETSVECPTSEYSPYYGFAIAVSKKAMGNDNTMSNLADYWMNKVPKKREAEKKLLLRRSVLRKSVTLKERNALNTEKPRNL